MKKLITYLFLLWVSSTHSALITTLNVQDAISPATSDYITRGINKSNEMNASLVVITLDTPGGLDKSMRDIIKSILSSSVPVAVFVSPKGARAASAGTFILYASHIAAMAPGTNIGAASPVNLIDAGATKDDKPNENGKKKDPIKASSEDKMSIKAMNDAIAYIRSLAQMKGRNVEWAEKAVLEAATLTAEEALKLRVIDIIAEDINALLTQSHHKIIKIKDREVKLDTEKPTLIPISPDWRSKFLAIITNPSVAYILLMMGVYGLFFEFSNPGFVLPGVAGGISLLIALYALQLLPISFAGLALIILGIIFMVAEAFIPSFGTLGIGGIIAFVIGSILLFDTELPSYQLALPLIMAIALFNAVFTFVVVGMAIKARKRKVVTGLEQLIGLKGVTLEAIHGEGHASVRGEIWLVQSKVPLIKAQPIRVIRVQGLKLVVEPDQEET